MNSPFSRLTGLLLPVFAALAWFPSLASAADPGGFVSLFNGRDLSGWSGNTKIWAVKDGVISATQTKTAERGVSQSSLVWKDTVPDDFELRLKFRLAVSDATANAGVRLRSGPNPESGAGYRVDLAMPRQSLGEIARLSPGVTLAAPGLRTVARDVNGRYKSETVEKLASADKAKASFRPGDWNEASVIARGNRLTTVINGHMVAEATDEHPSRLKSGALALKVSLIRGGESVTAEFKDVRIRKLSP